MLEKDIESEVLAISSKSEKILLEFLVELLEKSKLVGEQNIDEFLDRHKNFMTSEITPKDYQVIKDALKRQKVEFAIFKDDDSTKLCFKFNDKEKVEKTFEKLINQKLQVDDKGLKGLINESLNKFKDVSKTKEEKVKVNEFTLDER